MHKPCILKKAAVLLPAGFRAESQNRRPGFCFPFGGNNQWPGMSEAMVGSRGLEPLTFAMSTQRSNQLS